SVDLGGGAVVGLVVRTPEEAPTAEPELVPDRRAEVGIVQLETGTLAPDGLPAARLSCGGLVLTATGWGATAGQVAEVAERLALAVEDCPIDLDGLAGRYPELDLG
ncbi:MAG: hypothetical protein H5T83_13205, partial [Actinotalea sp.]|nr:hypothetical protein [Actinotalea sp.]